MKTITLTLILITISLGLYSQDFEAPKDYKLNKAEDYAPYGQDVIKCFDWSMNTPINEQATKRKEANAFLLKWLTGSPNVTIEIKQEILTFMLTSPGQSLEELFRLRKNIFLSHTSLATLALKFALDFLCDLMTTMLLFCN